MKNLKSKGIVTLIISFILMIVSIGLIIVNSKDEGESLTNKDPSLYQVSNSFKVDSPLGFDEPYEVNIYGIIENKSNEDIEDVVVRVYYFDTDRERQEVIIPTFDIEAKSEYTIDYDTTGEERAFYIDKVEYKIGNGNFKTLKGFTSASVITNKIDKSSKIIPFVFLLIFSVFGIFVGIAFTTYNMPTAEKIIDVFKPSVRKNIVTCKYCGSNNKHGTFKCTSCGAAIEYDDK